MELESVIDWYEHQERPARNISIHPGLKPNDLYNDVAIIVVNSEFIINCHEETICLPYQVFFDDEISLLILEYYFLCIYGVTYIFAINHSKNRQTLYLEY